MKTKTRRLKMKLETGIITAKDFNELYLKGTIHPYTNNRGGKLYDSRMVNKYAATWDTASSGCAVLEEDESGYMLRDFHNRAEALKRGLAAGRISGEEPLLIRVLPTGKGLTAYKNINSAKPHSSREKYSNPDLAFGHEIGRVLDLCKSFDRESLPPKFYQQIAYLIVDLRIRKRSEFAFTKNQSHTLTRFKDASIEDAEELVLNDTQVGAIAGAIDYFGEIVDYAKAQSPNQELSGMLNRLFAMNQFFGFVTFDFLFNRSLGDAFAVAKKVVRNQRKASDLVGNLTRGGVEQALLQSRELVLLIGTKTDS